jgi:2-polyprenyl-3-methyl-5-hydroxy-6-metoxy-1,4-benzoquinol methylase
MNRIEREKDFHDQLYAGDFGRRAAAGRFYAIAESVHEEYSCLVSKYAGRGESALEYGCGRGSYAFQLARQGATVSGFDISSVAISIASQKAESENLRVEFKTMDAHKLEYSDNAFDLVCGTGILHHLDLGRAIPELIRVTRPGGHAVFIEPLGHNPLINGFRKRTPSLRTEDEHPLLMSELHNIRQDFGGGNITFHYLATIGAAFVRGTFLFAPAMQVGKLLDSVLFKAPWFRKMAWMVLLDLEKQCDG